MAMAPIGPTNPAPGVMPTSPAIAPETPPSSEGCPRSTHSPKAQASAAAAVATTVFRMAIAATPVASMFEPALKPNQPTHKRQPPMKVKVRLCGAISSRP